MFVTPTIKGGLDANYYNTVITTLMIDHIYINISDNHIDYTFLYVFLLVRLNVALIKSAVTTYFISFFFFLFQRSSTQFV